MAGLFVPNMTPEQIANARKWIAALRSGMYQQGFGQLRFGNQFCCLGVECDVLGYEIDSLSPQTALTEEQARAVGLRTLIGRRGFLDLSLSTLNDVERAPFTEIADVIEAELALVTEVTA